MQNCRGTLEVLWLFVFQTSQQGTRLKVLLKSDIPAENFHHNEKYPECIFDFFGGGIRVISASFHNTFHCGAVGKERRTWLTWLENLIAVPADE